MNPKITGMVDSIDTTQPLIPEKEDEGYDEYQFITKALKNDNIDDTLREAYNLLAFVAFNIHPPTLKEKRKVIIAAKQFMQDKWETMSTASNIVLKTFIANLESIVKQEVEDILNRG